MIDLSTPLDTSFTIFSHMGGFFYGDGVFAKKRPAAGRPGIFAPIFARRAKIEQRSPTALEVEQRWGRPVKGVYVLYSTSRPSLLFATENQTVKTHA